MITRRDFVLNTLKMSLGAGMIPARGTKASSHLTLDNDPHMLLVIRVIGGMDSLLGLNPWTIEKPKVEDLHLGTNYRYLKSVGGTEINLGPSAFSLRPYVNDLVTVNGLFVGPSDLGHAAALNYMTTAKANVNAPHFITEVADHYRRSNNKEHEKIMFDGILNTFDHSKISRYPAQLLTKNFNQEGEFLKDFPAISEDKASFANIISKANDNIIREKKVASILMAMNKSSHELLPEHAVVASFACGLTRFAQLDWDMLRTLDSHVDHTGTHYSIQKSVWERVSNLIKLMKSTPYLDTRKPLFPNMVSLVILNEFSRFPYLNANHGKDHNYFDNSILLGGKGIKGGSSVGSHTLYKRSKVRQLSQLSGAHIDYKSGNTVNNRYFNTKATHAIDNTPSVDLIRPVNLLKTVNTLFGVGSNNSRLVPQDALVIPNVLKSK